MENLKKARIASGLTQEELGQKVNVQKSAISKYERGAIQPSQDILIKLSEVLGVSVDYLLGRTGTGYSISSDIDPSTIRITGFIPVFGEIPAGTPNFEDCQIIDYISTTEAHPDRFFALKVKGTSMIGAGIPDGAYVCFSKQNTAENGQIVACRLNGEEVTLKRFRRQGETIVLMPENPDYEPILVNIKDFAEGTAQILGVAKSITMKI